MSVKIEGNELVIRLPISNPAPFSATGKSKVIATTRGNVQTAVLIEGKPVTIGVNAYIPAR